MIDRLEADMSCKSMKNHMNVVIVGGAVEQGVAACGLDYSRGLFGTYFPAQRL